MNEESIKDIPEADHQHLQPQEREQEFVEEESADIDNQANGTKQKTEMHEDNRTPVQEIFLKSKYNFLRIQEVFRTREQERIRKRESSLDNDNMQSRLQKGNFSQIDQDFWTPMRERLLKDSTFVSESLKYIRTRMQEWIQKIENNLPWTPENFWTRIPERIQKSENKTTKTTKSRHSTITSLLLGSVLFTSGFCSAAGEFILVKSDSDLCKTDLSKLTDTCDHDEGKAIHCVLNDEGELGIGCFSKIWVMQGYCPYFLKSFGVLDIRLCLGNSSICPTDRDRYLSNEVYKYPGCLTYNFERVLDTSKTLNTSSTAIRSSDVGDGKYIRPLWISLTLSLFVLSPIIIF